MMTGTFLVKYGAELSKLEFHFRNETNRDLSLIFSDALAGIRRINAWTLNWIFVQEIRDIWNMGIPEDTKLTLNSQKTLEEKEVRKEKNTLTIQLLE